MDPNIYASLVFDGQKLSVPADRMGVPKDDQLKGTPIEMLAELAGRVCYDSLGKGRGSIAYHEHIKQVGHLSVYEHCVFTVAFRDASVDVPNPLFFQNLLPALVGRPGVWCETDQEHGPKSLRVTLNFRAVLEWWKWIPHVETQIITLSALGWHIQHAAHMLAPMIVPDPGGEAPTTVPFTGSLVTGNDDEPGPVNDEEKWVSLLLCGSRGMSHEQVRHGNFTAISQRSTRYVDESGSPWVDHPLVSQYEQEAHRMLGLLPGDGGQPTLAAVAGAVYDEAVQNLQPWLEGQGVDKHTARKQARGAARGYLGNALYTELIFTACVSQWLWMISQRGSIHADAEIRVLYSRILPQLQRSRYGDSFRHLRLEPSPDGIGEIIVG